MTAVVPGRAGPGATRGASPEKDGKDAAPRRGILHRLLGAQPHGLLFSAPYIVFVLVVFAYPVVFAVWMSFQDYFFANATHEGIRDYLKGVLAAKPVLETA
jgi:multiple sugar transport system permease protein